MGQDPEGVAGAVFTPKGLGFLKWIRETTTYSVQFRFIAARRRSGEKCAASHRTPARAFRIPTAPSHTCNVTTMSTGTTYLKKNPAIALLASASLSCFG